MNQNPETFVILFYAALVPVMVLLAIVLAWADKRFGSKQRDPLRMAIVRLKYASLIAAIVMFVILLRLPVGAHIGSANATEELGKNVDRILQSISIGLAVSTAWLAAAYSALKEFSASYSWNLVVPGATKEPV